MNIYCCRTFTFCLKNRVELIVTKYRLSADLHIKNTKDFFNCRFKL